jgi:diguanylate cyclase (GGDEF)-like protein
VRDLTRRAEQTLGAASPTPFRSGDGARDGRPDPRSSSSGSRDPALLATAGAATASSVPAADEIRPITPTGDRSEIPDALWIVLGSLGTAAVGAMLLGALLARRSRRTMASLSSDARTDALTGLLNRRGLFAALEAELARARRHGRELAVAYLDVEGLKRVNDRHGHQAGDRLLAGVARVIERESRAEDVCARLGGDEWAVVLVEPDAEGPGAFEARVAQRIERLREALPFDSEWGLTMGVAIFPHDGESADELLRVADRRLYARRGIELRQSA